MQSRKVKSEQSRIKIEPDISLDNATSTLKRTHKAQEEQQQPVAKRRAIDWPSEGPDSPKAQDGDFEEMSQTLSQVDIARNNQDMSSPDSPTPTSHLSDILEATPDLPFSPSDVEDFTDYTPESELSSSTPSNEPPEPSFDEPSSEEPPKVRKITDFFSAGHFDANRFFTPPTPPVRNSAEVKDESEAAGPSKPKPVKKKLAAKTSRRPVRSKRKPTKPAANDGQDEAPAPRRLIKSDPDEMSDYTQSEEGPSEEEQEETSTARRNRKKNTIVIDAKKDKRFERSSPPAAPETNLSLSQIKVLLQRIQDGLEPDLYDPNYYCRACPRTFDRQKTFHNHINSRHSVNIEERKFIILNYGPKPNITDMSMFCSHCQKQYQSKERFQHHNELHHGAERVKISTLAHKAKRGKLVRDNEINEDEMEEQERLETMEQDEKKNKMATLKDLENHRNLGYCQVAILKHRGPPPDINDPDFHCSVCNVAYSNRGSFHFHLRHVHKMVFPHATTTERRRKEYTGPPPDVNHPKHYCCVCDIYYSQKLVYTYHLRNVHNMDIPFDKSPGTRIAVDEITDESRKPDRFDPDYFCAYCNRGYTQRSSYLVHLIKMHFMDVPQRRPGALKPRPPLEPGISPDVLDPNHYCCVCDVKFAHANSYRIHIKKYHGLGDALEAITLKRRTKRSSYYLERDITNAGYHEERRISGQKKLDCKPTNAS